MVRLCYYSVLFVNCTGKSSYLTGCFYIQAKTLLMLDLIKSSHQTVTDNVCPSLTNILSCSNEVFIKCICHCHILFGSALIAHNAISP